MRRDSVLALDNRTGPMAASWLVSCLLHGGMAVAAMFFVQSMQLAPQTMPFQWNVAMIAPLSSGSAASTVLPAPPHHSPVSPTTDTRPTGRPVQTQQTALGTPPPTPISELTSELHQAQPPTTTPLAGDQAPTQPLHTTEPGQQDTLPPTVASSPSHSDPQTSADSPLDTSSSVLASSMPATQLMPAKADYGWLADLMARWIGDLDKRYPAMLRTEGIQGKVTLTAMLHEDGVLSDVRVTKSSGNTVLDQVAVEDVKNGPPIRLSRPLERPKMSVKFSIVYDLKTAR